MKQRRSRNSNTPLGTPRVIKPGELTERHRTILKILFWHRFLPTEWIIAHFPTVKNSKGVFRNNLGWLREEQNGYLKWADAPLNLPYAKNRQGIYELTPKGADAIGAILPKRNKNEDAHEFLTSLRECSLKFQARDSGLSFEFLEPQAYTLPSGKDWRPDGHPLFIGDTLIHGEDERRHHAEGKKKSIEKIDKILEYQRARLFESEGTNKHLVLFLSTSEGRTNTLMEYVTEKTNGKCSFIGFATTEDWAYATIPKPGALVTEWKRVGYPPLDLFSKGGAAS
jgi:hypothetical protein